MKTSMWKVVPSARRRNNKAKAIVRQYSAFGVGKLSRPHMNYMDGRAVCRMKELRDMRKETEHECLPSVMKGGLSYEMDET